MRKYLHQFLPLSWAAPQCIVLLQTVQCRRFWARLRARSQCVLQLYVFYGVWHDWLAVSHVILLLEHILAWTICWLIMSGKLALHTDVWGSKNVISKPSLRECDTFSWCLSLLKHVLSDNLSKASPIHFLKDENASQVLSKCSHVLTSNRTTPSAEAHKCWA